MPGRRGETEARLPQRAEHQTNCPPIPPQPHLHVTRNRPVTPLCSPPPYLRLPRHPLDEAEGPAQRGLFPVLAPCLPRQLPAAPGTEAAGDRGSSLDNPSLSLASAGPGNREERAQPPRPPGFSGVAAPFPAGMSTEPFLFAPRPMGCGDDTPHPHPGWWLCPLLGDQPPNTVLPVP